MEKTLAPQIVQLLGKAIESLFGEQVSQKKIQAAVGVEVAGGILVSQLSSAFHQPYMNKIKNLDYVYMRYLPVIVTTNSSEKNASLVEPNNNWKLRKHTHLVLLIVPYYKQFLWTIACLQELAWWKLSKPSRKIIILKSWLLCSSLTGIFNENIL
jgi:hypothetical protein